MQIRPAQFDELATALETHLHELPPKLIAIDGRCSAGKSSLGRFLAWYFNSTLIELDLFLSEGGLVHRYDDVKRIIKQRLDRKRPIFVEGITVLNVLEVIDIPKNYLIYVHNPRYPEGTGYVKELEEYETKYQPKSNADYVLVCEHGH
jgi:adenylate kinase family enzyme